MTILPYGDRALLINLEQVINHSIHDQVMMLTQNIEMTELHGVTFTIPAYCSITVGYDPALTDFQTLHRQLQDIEATGLGHQLNPRELKIPVCYDDCFALDLEEISNQTGLTNQAIIDIHSSHPFRVYMLGFLPGFVYLGRLPEELLCTRKKTPRLRVPALSVGLAGYQSGIYPCEAPGGWQIIGRTPIPIFSGLEDSPTLFLPGDQVNFHAIDKATFYDLEESARSDSFDFNQFLK